MKIISPRILIAGSALALIVSVTPVLAVDYGIGKAVNQVTKRETQASKAADVQANRLANAKKSADKMVDTRLSELNKISNRIQNDNKLSADEKSLLSTDVQDAISGLNAVRAKIDADTTIEAVRADAKSVITNYKVYEVMVPKMQLLITIDNLQALATNLQNLTPKLDDLISTLQSQGKDVSTATPIVADIKTQLLNINSKLAADKTTVMGVSPTTANPQATFSSVRKDLAGVREMFARVRADLGSLRQTINTIFKPAGTTSTPSGATTNR